MKSCAAAFMIALMGSSAAHAECLSYNTQVKLSGTLVTKKFPGRPNFGTLSHPDMPDEIDTLPILRVKEPICVNGDQDDLFDRAIQDVRMVQLLPDDPAEPKVEALVGKKVEASGTLFPAHTAGHRTPVLLWVSDVKQQD